MCQKSQGVPRARPIFFDSHTLVVRFYILYICFAASFANEYSSPSDIYRTTTNLACPNKHLKTNAYTDSQADLCSPTGYRRGWSGVGQSF